ncbi:MAG: DoxX family protein [FCB group bacterium]|nr:DoxX family protein [FCB group bacterium]
MNSKLLNWRHKRINQERQDYYKNLGLLILRIGIAVLMLFGHGSDKLVNFGQIATNFPDPLGVGSTFSLMLVVFAEFFCSLAIAFGFLTRWATIPLIFNMFIAAFVIHGGDSWGNRELALLYLLPYVTLLISGPGRFSLDHLIFEKHSEL